MGDKRTFPSVQKYNLIVVGIVCGILFWMFEAMAHMLFLGGSRYIRELFLLDFHEIWMRFTVFVLLVGFGWFGQRIVDRQKRIRMKLMESEERFRSLFENAPLGYQSLDANGDFVELNETWCKLLGYTKEEVLGRNFSEFIHPDFQDVFRENFPKFQSMGYILGVEFEMIKKDGSTIIVAFDGKIARNEDGSFKQTHCVLSDVTERKRVAQALLNEKLLSEEYINSMPGLFYVFDKKRFVRWNSEWEKVTGYSGEELATMYGPDFFEGEDRLLIAQRMQQVFSEGAAETEAEFVTKEGRRIPYFFTGLRKEFNGKLHLVGLGIDITRRRLAEQALLESENRLLESQQMAHLGNWFWDVKTGNVEWSDEVYRIFQLDPEAFTPQIDSILDLSPWPEDHERDKELIQRAIESREQGSYEQRFLRPDGSTGYYFSTFQGIYDAGGELVAMKGTVQDITERKQAETKLAEYSDHLEELVERRTRQLKEAQDELIRKERLAALGKVTAMVSHELRNPLGTVRTSVFSIGEAVKRDDMERVSRALALAERNIVRCDNIIDELLDFSRTRELKSEETDIEDWLASLLDEGIVPGEIACTREFHSSCKVPIDRERMRRVVINVLTNAIHAMQEDGASGNRLTVSTRVFGSRLEICFKDTGSGFSDKDLDRLFEPMFSTKDFGVGLGLSIVRGIMQQHGGDIEIRNNSGKGATVTLWLPLSKPEEA